MDLLAIYVEKNKSAENCNTRVCRFCFILSCSDSKNIIKLECGPMPNVMADLPNIGGALCSTPQNLTDTHYWSAVQ